MTMEVGMGDYSIVLVHFGSGAAACKRYPFGFAAVPLVVGLESHPSDPTAVEDVVLPSDVVALDGNN